MKIQSIRKGNLLAPFFIACWLLVPSVVPAQEASPPPPESPRPQNRADHERADRRANPERGPSERPRHDARPGEARELPMRMEKRARPEMARPFERGGKPIHPKMARFEARGPFLKLMHLKRAAMHLRAAGYEKQADLAQEEIKRVEKQIRDEMGKRMEQAREQGGPKEKPKDNKSQNAVGEANQNPSIDVEMKKMRREMEELRQQLRRMKAGFDEAGGRRTPGHQEATPPVPPTP